MLSSKAGQVCWLRDSEDVRDDIVGVNAIDQSGPVVVDKPAGHLNAVPGILAVVFLQASGERQVSWGHLLDPEGYTSQEAHPTLVIPGGRPGSAVGNTKGRDARRAAHPPGDRKLMVLHHHCGICLCGVGAWVEVGHFIIKGVKELSWKGTLEAAVTGGRGARGSLAHALHSVGAHWKFSVT